MVRSDRSKNTIVLPALSHNYGDRIFDKQSASTMQKTILVYSMPKAPRFKNQYKYSGQPTYCVDSCFRSNSTKGVGFGFGRKKQFPDWMERNMKQNPAPGAYFEGDDLSRTKGPTFGISRKFYEKVLIPKQVRTSNNTQARKLSPIAQKQ